MSNVLNKKIISAAPFFAVLLSGIALAQGGGMGGNGGAGVVCRDTNGKVMSVEVLDRYEAEVIRGIVPKIPASASTSGEILGVLLERLAIHSPLRAQEYVASAKDFRANAHFVYGQTLEKIHDTENMAFPDGCAVEQIIIQRIPEFPEDERYLVNGDLWRKLGDLDQAVLISHELILGEMQKGFATCTAQKCPEIETRELRYFNSLLFADKAPKGDYDIFFGGISAIPYLEYDEYPAVRGRIPRENWCRLRLTQLDGKPGYLLPFCTAANPDTGRYHQELVGFESLNLMTDSWIDTPVYYFQFLNSPNDLMTVRIDDQFHAMGVPIQFFPKEHRFEYGDNSSDGYGSTATTHLSADADAITLKSARIYFEPNDKDCVIRTSDTLSSISLKRESGELLAVTPDYLAGPLSILCEGTKNFKAKGVQGSNSVVTFRVKGSPSFEGQWNYTIGANGQVYGRFDLSQEMGAYSFTVIDAQYTLDRPFKLMPGSSVDLTGNLITPAQDVGFKYGIWGRNHLRFSKCKTELAGKVLDMNKYTGGNPEWFVCTNP